MLGFTRLSGSKWLYPKGDTARKAESHVEPMTDAYRPSAIPGFSERTRCGGVERRVTGPWNQAAKPASPGAPTARFNIAQVAASFQRARPGSSPRTGGANPRHRQARAHKAAQVIHRVGESALVMRPRIIGPQNPALLRVCASCWLAENPGRRSPSSLCPGLVWGRAFGALEKGHHQRPSLSPARIPRHYLRNSH